jgi:hypothetical protein
MREGGINYIKGTVARDFCPPVLFINRFIPRSGPYHRKTLEVEFLGKFESLLETALDHESEDQLGTFGEIT